MSFFLLSKFSEPLAWKGNFGHSIQMYSFQQTPYANYELSTTFNIKCSKVIKECTCSQVAGGNQRQSLTTVKLCATGHGGSSGAPSSGKLFSPAIFILPQTLSITAPVTPQSVHLFTHWSSHQIMSSLRAGLSDYSLSLVPSTAQLAPSKYLLNKCYVNINKGAVLFGKFGSKCLTEEVTDEMYP